MIPRLLPFRTYQNQDSKRIQQQSPHAEPGMNRTDTAEHTPLVSHGVVFALVSIIIFCASMPIIQAQQIMTENTPTPLTALDIVLNPQDLGINNSYANFNSTEMVISYAEEYTVHYVCTLLVDGSLLNGTQSPDVPANSSSHLPSNNTSQVHTTPFNGTTADTTQSNATYTNTTQTNTTQTMNTQSNMSQMNQTQTNMTQTYIS